MKNIYIIIGAFFLLFLFSCEDHLELEYQNGYIGENFMQSENQASEAVTAIYDVLNWVGYYNFASYILGEAPTDNIENDWGDGNFGPSIVLLNGMNWQGDNRYFAERWNAGYAGISRCNYLLNKIDDIDEDKISDEKRAQFKGEAQFLRAYFYYSMIIGFGEIPLVTEVLSAQDANTVEKASMDELWGQIKSDLISAQTLLADSVPSTEELGRATSGAASALLSRVYLWTNEWQAAVNAADAVTGYNLVDSADYSPMFDGTGEFNSESIFEVVRIQDWGNMWNGTMSETSQLMHLAPRNPWGDYLHPRKKGNYDVLDYFEDGDMRRTASIYVPYVDSVPYEGVMGIFPDTAMYQDWRPNITNDDVYQMRKFLPGDASVWAKGGAFFRQYDMNHTLLRYAEIILNKAEALIELNELPGAVAEIQKIRSRAGLTDMIDGSLPSLPSISGVMDINDMNQAQLREVVRQERRVELFFEGHRWYDLKRWDILGTVLPAAGFDYNEANNKYWPIPTQEIEINPNLAK